MAEEVVSRAGLALLLGVLALVSSGIGRLALAGSDIPSPGRKLAAECVVGGLAYTTVFAIATHIGLPFFNFLQLLVGFALVGILGLAWPLHNTRQLAIRAIVATSIAASVLAAQNVPSNGGAFDATTYAYMTTVLFHGGWMSENLGQLSDYLWLRNTASESVLARSAALALVWPAAASGLAVSARLVAGTAQWCLIPAFLAIVDILRPRASLLASVVIALGAIGAFNEVAVLVNGQLNQAFSLAVILAAVWACRRVEDRRAQRMVLALAGANITAGYPEFLAAVPLYLVCCALGNSRSLADMGIDFAAFASGWLLIQVSTGLQNGTYLLAQVDLGPGWWPLPEMPTNVADVWRYVVLGLPMPAYLVAAVLPIAGYVWWTNRAQAASEQGSPRLAFFCLTALIVSTASWSWLALHSGNPNYATFKLAGWLGPGLFLFVYLLVAHGKHPASRAAAVLLILVATTRLIGLAWDTRQNVIAYVALPPTIHTWNLAIDVGGNQPRCYVQLRSQERRAMMAAVSETAAPARGCRLLLNPRSSWSKAAI